MVARAYESDGDCNVTGIIEYRDLPVSKGDTDMEIQDGVFPIRKDAPNSGTISRCLQAIQKQDFSAISRADIDGALDSIAKSLAAQEGIEYGEAFAAVLTGESGRALYQAREEIPVSGNGKPVAKYEVSKAEMMESEAQRYAEVFHVDISRARALVADYHRG